MFIRIIILGVVIALAVMLYRKMKAPNQVNTRTGSSAPAMKKCAQCGVHLPEPDAIRSGEHYFCSEQHRLTYDNDHPRHD